MKTEYIISAKINFSVKEQIMEHDILPLINICHQEEIVFSTYKSMDYEEYKKKHEDRCIECFECFIPNKKWHLFDQISEIIEKISQGKSIEEEIPF